LIKLQDNHSNAGFALAHYLNSQRQIISQALNKLITTHFTDSRLSSAMQYSLMASGKRLRPVLCMAAAETVFH